MFLQYGELSSTSGWDLLASLGHPSKFQQVSRLGSVTVRHSSSGRQPNFAALNRGRHVYSAGQPPRLALAHILHALVLIKNLWPNRLISVADYDVFWCLRLLPILIIFMVPTCRICALCSIRLLRILLHLRYAWSKYVLHKAIYFERVIVLWL